MMLSRISVASEPGQSGVVLANDGIDLRKSVRPVFTSGAVILR